jgi:hypothetical protein
VQKADDLFCNIFLFAALRIEPSFASGAPRTMAFREPAIAPAAPPLLRGIAGRR